jgi:hypothetical protein
MATDATTSKPSFLTQLFNGDIPSVDLNTDVSMTNASIVNIGAIIFVAGFLIVLTWYLFKKNLQKG